jgi:hypothetical protein
MGIRPAGLGAVIGSPRPSRIGHLPVEILESKLFKPGIRPGVVPRPHLAARLLPARAVPTVALVAPAGYGKTTLLARAGPRARPGAPAEAQRLRRLLSHALPSREPTRPQKRVVAGATSSLREPGTTGGWCLPTTTCSNALSPSRGPTSAMTRTRRSAVGPFEYSANRFVGHCAVCARALAIPATGEPLSDVRAAIQFVATHDHGQAACRSDPSEPG